MNVNELLNVQQFQLLCKLWTAHNAEFTACHTTM